MIVHTGQLLAKRIRDGPNASSRTVTKGARDSLVQSTPARSMRPESFTSASVVSATARMRLVQGSTSPVITGGLDPWLMTACNSGISTRSCSKRRKIDRVDQEIEAETARGELFAAPPSPMAAPASGYPASTPEEHECRETSGTAESDPADHRNPPPPHPPNRQRQQQADHAPTIARRFRVSATVSEAWTRTTASIPAAVVNGRRSADAKVASQRPDLPHDADVVPLARFPEVDVCIDLHASAKPLLSGVPRNSASYRAARIASSAPGASGRQKPELTRKGDIRGRGAPVSKGRRERHNDTGNPVHE